MATGTTRPTPIARVRRRAFPTLLAVLVAIAGAFLPGAPASAGPPAAASHAAALHGSAPHTVVSSALSCYGGAVSHFFGAMDLPGPFYTTNRCRDINARVTAGDAPYVIACVIFVNHTDDCNYYTRVERGWVTIATDVLDGTKFVVVLETSEVWATANVQLAF